MNNKLYCTYYVLLLVSLFGSYCVGEMWSFHFPDPSEAEIRAIASNNEKILAAGIEGTLLQSLDGIRWEMCVSPLDGNYISVLYTDAFYVVNEDFKIARSVNGDCTGANWTLLTTTLGPFDSYFQISPSPPPSPWSSGFVAIMNGQLYYSLTGGVTSSWTRITKFQSYKVLGVTYGRNQWIVKLTISNTNNIFFTNSTNGRVWGSPIDSGFSGANDDSISYCSGKGLYIASFSEGLGSSSDGLYWDITEPNMKVTMHSIVCVGDRCVGATNSDIYSSNTCDVDWSDVQLPSLRRISNAFPVQSFVVNKGINSTAIMVGGNDGLIFANTAPGTWLQTGTPQEQANDFYLCNELVYSGKKFVVGCYKSVLQSSDGKEWEKDSYSLSSTNDKQLSLITSNNQGLLAAEGESDIFFVSDNHGSSWDFNTEFKLHEDDDFDIYQIKALKDSWIVLASDTWSIRNSSQFTPYYDHDPNSLQVYNPFVLVSNSYNPSSWKAYGSNAWILDLLFSPTRKIYIGAGKGGIFSSANLYEWTRISEVNGECYTISENDGDIMVALCTNTVGSVVDNIVKVSTNDGLSWTNYKSPCTTSSRLTRIPITCKYLQYLNSIKSFAIFSDQISGMIYLSKTPSTNWSQLNFPYAQSIWGIADNDNSKIVMLTDEVIVSDDAYAIKYGNTVNTITYTSPTVAPPVATFPMVGLLKDTDHNYEDDEEDLSGGAVAGIVIGSIFGAILFVIVAVVLVIGFFVLYKRANKGPEDTALLLYEEL